MEDKQPANQALYDDCLQAARIAHPDALQHEIKTLADAEYEHRFSFIGLEGQPWEPTVGERIDEFFKSKGL